ncbi:MAG: hypothetical protein K2I44_10445, partial [Muribaculaceae bacterium]|nr:hypothetical protein [Muribaculaceae bacterium]
LSMFKDRFWRVFAIIALIAFCVIGYINASKNRYRMIHDTPYVLDSWTGNIKDLRNQFSNN